MSILKLDNISYNYIPGKNVLDNINYRFKKGKVYSIVGKSGSGKTTLLSVLSGLAEPSEGTIFFNNRSIATLDKYKYRSQDVGVIFQSYNLLPYLDAVENVELSMDIAGIHKSDKREYALKLLASVGIDDATAHRRVLQLSGGEQQRVAIARSLSYNPDILLADEPTGNLDGETQDEIINIFQELAHNEGKCIIIVTHSPVVSESSDLVYNLSK